MRAFAGFIGLQALLAGVGVVVLASLRLARADPRGLVAAVGPGYLCGIAVVVPLLSALVVAGVPFGLPLVLAASLGSAGAFALAGRLARGRLPPAPPSPPAGAGPERLLAGGLAATIAVFLLLAATAYPNLPIQGDNAHIWSPKALSLLYEPGLDTPVFTPGLFNSSQPGYPILQPLLQASTYRAMGTADLPVAHLQIWLLVAALAWSAAFLLHGRGRTLAWLPVIGALAVGTELASQVSMGFADVTVGVLVALGALLAGSWVDRGRVGEIVLAGLVLGAAANTKNEGLAAAAALLVAAGAAGLAGRGRGALPAWGLGAGLAALSAAPWRLHVRATDVPAAGDLEVGGEALTPASLWDRLDRLGIAVEEVAAALGDQPEWMWLAPSMLAVGLVCLAVGVARPVALFYLASLAGLVAAVCWAYWTGPFGVRGYIENTLPRVSVSLHLMSGLALAHLVALVSRVAWEREPADAAPGFSYRGAGAPSDG